MNGRPLFALILLGLAVVGCTARGATWERITSSGTMRVGLDPTYPPFENADSGTLVGVDVDLARAVGDELGVAVEFVYFGYDGLYDALDTAQVDVLLSALVVAPERTRDFAYSVPYFDAGQQLISPNDTPIEAMTALDGRTLAVELGAEGHVIATTWQRRLAALEVVPYNSPDEALTAVAAGNAAAALVDAISGRLFIANTPSLQAADEIIAPQPYAAVMRIEDERLLEEINGALIRLREDGRLATIISRWLDNPLSP